MPGTQDQQSISPSYKAYNAEDVLAMPPNENPVFFDSHVADGFADPEQDEPEIFCCTQCQLKSRTREQMEHHVVVANVHPRVQVTCPACRSFACCLADDLINKGGHLDECPEAHRIGWEPSNGYLQYPMPLQHMIDAMLGAVPRAEGYVGEARIWSTGGNFAQMPAEETLDSGAAYPPHEMSTGAAGDMPPHGWTGNNQPWFEQGAVAPEFHNYFAEGVPEDQQPQFSPFGPPTLGVANEQLPQQAQANHLGHTTAPQGFDETRGESYDKTSDRDQHEHYPSVEASTRSAGEVGSRIQMGNQEASTYYAPKPAESPTDFTPMTSAIQQVSIAAIPKPSLGAYSSDNVDEFIRSKGAFKPAVSSDPVEDDSDEESEEETLAKKSAWKPRPPRLSGASPPDAAGQGPGPGTAVAFDSQTVASKPAPNSQPKQGHRSAPQSSNSTKKPGVKRSKQKAPSMLQAMKAARATKRAEEAAQDPQPQPGSQLTLPQQADHDEPTTRQTAIEQAASTESVPPETMPEQAILRQPTTEQATPQQVTPSATVPLPTSPPQAAAKSKKRRRAGDDEPSALEQLKRRHMGHESRSKTLSTRSNKVTIVSGPKRRSIVPTAQAAPTSSPSIMAGGSSLQQNPETQQDQAPVLEPSHDRLSTARESSTAGQQMPHDDKIGQQTGTGQDAGVACATGATTEGEAQFGSNDQGDQEDQTTTKSESARLGTSARPRALPTHANLDGTESEMEGQKALGQAKTGQEVAEDALEE